MFTLALQVAEKVEKSASTGDFWSIVPSVLWIGVILVVVLLYRVEIGSILANLSWRIRIGAPVKVFSFELGQAHVQPGIDVSQDETTLESRKDVGDERLKQREQFYLPNRRIFLVHRIAPTKTPDMLYDIALYLVPHKEATLASVARVEYYFGKFWDRRVFTSQDRARSFMVTTSAYGPFVCTAKICFTDGEEAIVARYVDFEMGALGQGA